MEKENFLLMSSGKVVFKHIGTLLQKYKNGTSQWAHSLFFRFVMSNLNISGRRIVEMWEVEEMIKAVDDGDGNLSYEEFIQLIQQQNVTGTSANGAAEKN